MIDIFKRERIIESNESSVRKKIEKNGFKHNRKKQYLQINEISKSKEYSKKNIIKEQYPKSSITVIPLKSNSKNASKVVFSKEYPHSNTLVVSADKTEFTGEVMAKIFKTYRNIIDKCLKFCDKHGEYMQRDLVAMVLYRIYTKV